MSSKTSKVKNPKLIINKNLKDFMKDESGYMTKENVLKVAVGTLTGFGVLMAAEQANADTNTTTTRPLTLMDLWNATSAADRTALMGAMGSVDTTTGGTTVGGVSVAGACRGQYDCGPTVHTNSNTVQWAASGGEKTMFPSHTHHSVHDSY